MRMHVHARTHARTTTQQVGSERNLLYSWVKLAYDGLELGLPLDMHQAWFDRNGPT